MRHCNRMDDADDRQRDVLLERAYELECLIASAMPTTIDGAIAVATFICQSLSVYPSEAEQLAALEPETLAGARLACWFLANHEHIA